MFTSGLNILEGVVSVDRFPKEDSDALRFIGVTVMGDVLGPR